MDTTDQDHRIIRLDPDFDYPLRDTLSQKKHNKPIHELLKPMNEMCSVRSISSLLHLPARIVESHEEVSSDGLSCFLLPQTSPQFQFLTKILHNYKDSMLCEEKDQLLAPVHDPSSIMDNVKLLPRKICLDTDIDPFAATLDEGKKSKPSNKAMGTVILGLPSFSGMMSFASSRKSLRRGANFVNSSSRVSNVDALQNVVGSSKATSMFLPQSITTKRPNQALAERRRLKAMEQNPKSTSLLSAIRSCVPGSTENDMTLLQRQCTAYPVASWFGSDMSNNTSSISEDASEIDGTILNLKRKTFCQNAKARSSSEGSRTLLLTGCSSRRNAQHKYGYRGFLTNQAVPSRVFQLRYNAMLQVTKCHDHRNLSSSSASPSHDNTFSRMALGIFATAFTRHKDNITKKTGKSRVSRSAPYSLRLNNKRHGNFQITASTSKRTNSRKTPLPTDDSGLISISKIDDLACCSNARLTADSTAEESHCGGLDFVENLGQQSLKVRGELLHLVTKAIELEDEKKSYLANLAKVNRSRVQTPKNVGLVDVTETIDLTIPDDLNRKRKADDATGGMATEQYASTEVDEQKDAKKKRKKEKKKRKKKHKKRKPKKQKVEVSEIKVAKIAKTSEPIEQIAFPIGMTPINPPNKRPQILKNPELPQGESTDENLAPELALAPKDSTPEFCGIIASEKSPDSVAQMLNPTTKPTANPLPHEHATHEDNSANNYHSFDEMTERDQYHHQSTTHDKNGDARQEEEESHIADQSHKESHNELHNQSHDQSQLQIEESWNDQSKECPQRTLLTSESFLETFGEIVAELASGRWQKALTNSELNAVTHTPKGIVACDCPLLDIAGADIELPDASAIIVQSLLSWSADNGNMQKGARSFIRRLVSLAASGRFSSLHVILLLDVEMSPALSTEIVTLQNSVIQQSGCPCDYVTFEYVARPRAVAASIAIRSASVSTPHESSQIAEFVLDENVQERARLLVMLVPTMTVHMALKCLGYSSESRNNNVEDSSQALQNLFRIARQSTRDLFPYKMEGILSQRCAHQLWMALNVDVSHAF